ncbi:MAG: PEGA domain-containing protein, partial [Myxococcota bacterium]
QNCRNVACMASVLQKKLGVDYAVLLNAGALGRSLLVGIQFVDVSAKRLVKGIGGQRLGGVSGYVGRIRKLTRKCLSSWMEVSITGQPKGADVRVDGVGVGVLPLRTFYLPRKAFLLEVSMLGYLSFRKKVEPPNESVILKRTIKLSPKPVPRRSIVGAVVPRRRGVVAPRRIVKPPPRRTKPAKARPNYAWLWVVGSVVVVGATAGIWVAVVAQQEHNQMPTAL